MREKEKGSSAACRIKLSVHLLQEKKQLRAFHTNNKEEERVCYKLYLRQRNSKGNKEIAANIPFPSVQINACSAHGNHSPGSQQLHTEGTLTFHAVLKMENVGY
jgi:hypothetical protein